MTQEYQLLFPHNTASLQTLGSSCRSVFRYPRNDDISFVIDI